MSTMSTIDKRSAIISPRCTSSGNTGVRCTSTSQPATRKILFRVSIVGDDCRDSYFTMAAGDVPARRASSRFDKPDFSRASLITCATSISPLYQVLSIYITPGKTHTGHGLEIRAEQRESAIPRSFCNCSVVANPAGTGSGKEGPKVPM